MSSLRLLFGAHRLTHSVATCVTILAAAFGLALMSRAEPKPVDREMPREVSILSWKGEQVILLPGAMPWEPNYRDFYHYRNGERGGNLTKAEYGNRTGVITDVRFTGVRPYRRELKTFELLITLDGSQEQIVVNDNVSELGFHRELESAKKFVGRTFWARGGKVLTQSVGQAPSSAKELVVKNTEMLTVSRVAWGQSIHPELCLTTKANQEGCWSYFICYESRFTEAEPPPQCADNTDLSVIVANALYSEDPRKLYPGWSRVIWSLIEKGEISIGMSEKMAEVACGGKLDRHGSILESQETVLPILGCGSKRFLIGAGKVIRYIEPK